MTTSNDSLRLRLRVDAPPATVFKALTDPDALSDWLTESAEVALDQGRYEFWGRYTPQGQRARQRLLAAEENRLLRFTWTFEGSAESTVELALSPDEGTLVTMTHTGIPESEASALSCFWHVSMSNLAAHCAGLATMPPFDFSVPAQGDALVRTVIDVPVEEVFASLLDPAQVDRWTGGKAVIEAKMGGRYEMGSDHGPTQIVELEPDRVLAYTWHHAGSPDTVVRWQLRGSRGSTFLTLVHSGFADDTLAERYRQSWPGHLVELKRLLELGPRFQPIKV